LVWRIEIVKTIIVFTNPNKLLTGLGTRKIRFIYVA
jgi:hypothetical protein